MTHHKVRGRRTVPRLEVRRALEALEPRALMAVVTVNSTADILKPPAGTVTLRSAIQAANTTPGMDTINLPLAGTYKVTTIGTNTDNTAGEFAIADAGDLTIRNTSGGAVTIDGGGLNRVFDVDPAGSAIPYTVTFSGLVVTGGLAFSGDGGGIEVHGAASVVLNGCNVSGNAATSGAGIAMEALSSGSLVLNSTQVARNRAGGGGGGIAGLGTGAVAIGTGSLIAENVANGQDGGGGVLVRGAPLNVGGAVIRGNRCLIGPGGLPGTGGGISDRGAGAVAIAGTIVEDNTSVGNGGGYGDTGLAALSVRNSFFLDNSAVGDGGGIAAGGPLIAITNTTVAGNSALVGVSGSGIGGGVYVSGTGTSRVTDSTIVGNTAMVTGGGIEDDHAARLIVTGGTFADNRALQVGGGGLDANLATGDVTISNSLFRDNAAGQFGGGLFSSNGKLEITASRFTGNAAQYGGAADVGLSVFSIGGSTFDANRALNGSGALSIELNTGDSLTNSTIVGNVSSDQGAIGLFGSPTGSMAMIDDTIDGNTSTNADGGGVYQAIGTLTVQGTILAGNTAAGSPVDYKHVGGTLTDGGGNLLGTTAGAAGKFSVGTIFAAPKLGPLEDNGGQVAGGLADSQVVPTQALLPGSPAFSTGIATGAPATDERGFARRPSPSIGAYQPLYSSTAPINAVFVEDLYETLLGRPGDPAGLLAGFNFLNGGGTPTALAQVFEASAEFLGREADRIVHRYLDRTPSPTEVNNVFSFLASGRTPEQAASIFINSPEFAGDYGSNQDVYVEAMYQTVLGRAAAPSEVAGWGQALGAGLTRPALVNLFLSSDGYMTDLIADDFPAYLGRPATPQDTAAFLNAARSGVSSLTLRAILLGSSFATRA